MRLVAHEVDEHRDVVRRAGLVAGDQPVELGVERPSSSRRDGVGHHRHAVAIERVDQRLVRDVGAEALDVGLGHVGSVHEVVAVVRHDHDLEKALAHLVLAPGVDVDVLGADAHVTEAALEDARVPEAGAARRHVRPAHDLHADVGLVGHRAHELVQHRLVIGSPASRRSTIPPIVSCTSRRTERSASMCSLNARWTTCRRASGRRRCGLRPEVRMSWISSRARRATPEGPGRVADAGEADHAQAVDAAAAAGLAVEEPEGAPLLDELLGDRVVEAAGAPESHHVPVAGDLDGVLRHEEGQDLGHPGVVALRLPSASRTSAPPPTQLARAIPLPNWNRPWTWNPPSAGGPCPGTRTGRRRRPRDAPRASGGDVGIEHGAHRRRVGVRHEGPADGAVLVGDLLEDVEHRVDVGLQPAELLRDLEVVEAGRGERLDRPAPSC